jgi:ribosomal protein S18 acetylase RimI-like enzyme
MVEIAYAVNKPIAAADFVDLLRRSTLAERRPIDDGPCIQGMLDHANLLVTAYAGDLLVGVSRSVTDFQFCCYLSDLAVDQAFQRHGIGQELIRLTQHQLGPRCTLILLSAPAAVDYYPHIGFEHHPQAWVLKPGAVIKTRRL